MLVRCLPWPLLRDVRRAEPLSPGVSPLVSPREALGSLQAATAALLGFTFILERYGDPTVYIHTVYKQSWSLEGGFVKYLQKRSYLEREEACQKISSSLFSDSEQTQGVKAEDRRVNQTNSKTKV